MKLSKPKLRKSKLRKSKLRKSKLRKSKLRKSKLRKSKQKRLSKKRSAAKCMRNKVGFVMREFKNKSLRLRSGQVVKNRKQAIAIALSIGRKSCEPKQKLKLQRKPRK